jgi:Uma2 family endonuclease
MVSTQPATGYTYEDYLKTSDDERWELLDGELVMAPSPNMSHQRVATDLVTLLNAFVQESGLGSVYAAPADVVLSDTSVVQRQT